jgi:hypothetical protein
VARAQLDNRAEFVTLHFFSRKLKLPRYNVESAESEQERGVIEPSRHQLKYAEKQFSIERAPELRRRESERQHVYVCVLIINLKFAHSYIRPGRRGKMRQIILIVQSNKEF